MKKTCFKCSKEKDLGDFYPHPQMADGHLNKCKECTKRDVKANYRKNLEHYKEYERGRFRRPERRAYLIELQRSIRRNNHEKYKARVAVGNALRSGLLVREPCAVCGEERSQAHHPDYSKPLDVVWLCHEHHRKEHGQLDYL